MNELHLNPPYEPWDDHAPPADPNAPLSVDFSFTPFESIGDPLSSAAVMFFRDLPMILTMTLMIFAPLELIKSYLFYTQNIAENTWQAYQISGVLNGIFTPLLTGSVIYVLIQRLRGQTDIRLGAALKFGGRVWLRLIVINLLAGVAIALGFVCLIVPGVIFMIWFSLVDAVVCIEGLRIRHVLTRSMDLTEGRRFAIFIVLLVAAACLFVVVMLLSIPLAAVPQHWLTNAAITCLFDIAMVYLIAVKLAIYLGVIVNDYNPATDPLNPYEN